MGYDEMAVVDGQGRVHGLEGLRVVDASIMPLIITGNLNATTIMIAEKIADRHSRARAAGEIHGEILRGEWCTSPGREAGSGGGTGLSLRRIAGMWSAAYLYR